MRSLVLFVFLGISFAMFRGGAATGQFSGMAGRSLLRMGVSVRSWNHVGIQRGALAVLGLDPLLLVFRYGLRRRCGRSGLQDRMGAAWGPAAELMCVKWREVHSRELFNVVGLPLSRF